MINGLRSAVEKDEPVNDDLKYLLQKLLVKLSPRNKQDGGEFWNPKHSYQTMPAPYTEMPRKPYKLDSI